MPNPMFTASSTVHDVIAAAKALPCKWVEVFPTHAIRSSNGRCVLAELMDHPEDVCLAAEASKALGLLYAVVVDIVRAADGTGAPYVHSLLISQLVYPEAPEHA